MPKKPGQTTKPETRRIEVFRPGTFTAMSGASFTATADDLIALAARYDAETDPVPVVIGHPKTDTPAYGWVEAFAWDKDSERLIAEIGDLEPQFADAVSEGRYKKISMSFHMPGASANPAGDALYPKHVGFLGGTAPAVHGLQPVSFQEEEGGTETVELASSFADPAFKDVASVFRRFRDWLIEKEGLKTADQVLPDFEINWIDRAGNVPSVPDPLSDFSDPLPEDPSMPKPLKRTPARKPAPQPDNEAFAERVAEIEAREQDLLAREAGLVHAGHVSFADTLIDEGQLATGSRDRVIALLDQMAVLEADDVSFSENGRKVQVPPLELLKDLLRTQPKLVEFGQIDTGDEPNGEADPETIAAEAIAFQASQREAGIEISVSAAVTHVEQKRGLASS